MTFVKWRNSEEIIDTGEYWIFKHSEKPDLLWIAKQFLQVSVVTNYMQGKEISLNNLL